MCTTPCAYGWGMCLAPKHGLVILSDYFTQHLCMYSLADGSLVKTIGGQNAHGEGRFNFNIGGLCITPGGDSVLVADFLNNRVQEVNIMDGSWVRSVGEGVLWHSQFVDCNTDVIVVANNLHRVCVFSWHAGDLISQFGGYGSGPGQLKYPRGIRLLSGCPTTQLVVADSDNHRLCVFELSGEFVRAIGSRKQGLNVPFDVLECCADGCFVVANYGTHNVVKLSPAGEVVGVYGGTTAPGDSEFRFPSALAALPAGGLVVREKEKRLQVFHGLDLRVEWITACVSLARGGDAL